MGVGKAILDLAENIPILGSIGSTARRSHNRQTDENFKGLLEAILSQKKNGTFVSDKEFIIMKDSSKIVIKHKNRKSIDPKELKLFGFFEKEAFQRKFNFNTFFYNSTYKSEDRLLMPVFSNEDSKRFFIVKKYNNTSSYTNDKPFFRMYEIFPQGETLVQDSNITIDASATNTRFGIEVKQTLPVFVVPTRKGSINGGTKRNSSSNKNTRKRRAKMTRKR